MNLPGSFHIISNPQVHSWRLRTMQPVQQGGSVLQNPAQAIKYWQQVRVLLQQQPRTPEIDSLRIFANAQIAWLGWREGMTADAAQEYTVEALGWARDANDEMIPILLFVDGRITVAGGGAADTYV